MKKLIILYLILLYALVLVAEADVTVIVHNAFTPSCMARCEPVFCKFYKQPENQLIINTIQCQALYVGETVVFEQSVKAGWYIIEAFQCRPSGCVACCRIHLYLTDEEHTICNLTLPGPYQKDPPEGQ